MNNVVEKFKKGSGIHIKESLKGSFTRWCGGNVTSECILRGKNSSNPKIRKKATFADNARHFKHRLGGSIERQVGKYQLGDKIKRTVNEEAVRNNRSNRAIAKGMFNGMLSGDILPTLPNLWRMTSAGFNGYFNRENKNPNLITGIVNVIGTPMSSLSAVSTASRAMGGPKNIFSLNKLWRMVNKRVGRTLDFEEFSDLISNSSINNIRNAAIESNNNFPMIRITELEANDFINSLKPGLKQGGSIKLANARKWKHKDGGNLVKKPKQAFVPGASITDSNPDAYKYVKKKYKMHLLGGTIDNYSQIGTSLMGLVSSIKQNNLINSSINNLLKQIELDKKKLFLNNYKNSLGLQTDNSSIVNANRAYTEASNQDYSDLDSLFLLLKQELLNKKLLVENLIIDYGGLIGQGILGIISSRKPKTYSFDYQTPSFNSNSFRSTADSSNKVYTTLSGLSDTVDGWRKTFGL